MSLPGYFSTLIGVTIYNPYQSVINA